MPCQLQPYQQVARNFIYQNNYTGLFLDCGLGKTVITLDALYQLALQGFLPPGHILIVAPKNIAKSTWIDEIEKWNYPFRWCSLIINDKGNNRSKKERWNCYQQLLTQPQTLCFINRELLVDCIDYYTNQNIPFPFQTVILDESQGFKSHTSKRFKALKKVRPYIHRLIELTGTPSPNGYMDLWAQIYLLDMGARLGQNITTYRARYFTPTRYIHNVPTKWILNQGCDALITQQISDITLSMKNTLLQLPALTINDVPIILSKKEMDLYKTLKKDAVLELQDDDTQTIQEIVASNAAVLSAKLGQLASGTIYTDDETSTKRAYQVIHQQKCEQTAYIINNTNDCILVAYHYKSELEQLLKYLPKHCDNKRIEVFSGNPNQLKEFNEKKIDVLLIHPQSSGHGLNFQYGSHTLIWYTLPFSLEHYMQTNARLHRKGQTEPVVIHRLITKDTIDTRKCQLLSKKKITQDDLLDALCVEIEDNQ